MRILPVITLMSRSIPKMVGNSRETRMQRIKNILFSSKLVDAVKYQHPDIKKLLNIWEDYLFSAKENLESYKQLKSLFTEIFGAKNWDFFLDSTWYFYRTDYLVRKNIEDSDNAKKY